MKKHSLLSPSAAHRWLNCTPSALDESKYPEESSIYALEGSLAHAICERELLKCLDRDTTEVCKEIDRLVAEFGEPTNEMVEYADAYADSVMGYYNTAKERGNAEIHIETPLDITEWIPLCHGTADCVIVDRDTLVVIDFKYGRGVQVDARENPQMRAYALGALDEFGVERDIKTICTVIIQPRVSNFSSEVISADTLYDWGENYLKPLAAVASRGLGAHQPGDWCRFCRAKGECRALDLNAARMATVNIDRTDADSIGEVCLPMVEPLKLWIESVESKALAMLLQGKTVPGYKAVRKRTVRKITDERLAIDLLKGAGYNEADYYREPQLRTITELEKKLGKTAFNAVLGEAVVKAPGEPTLAPMSDRRAPINAADSFNEININ